MGIKETLLQFRKPKRLTVEEYTKRLMEKGLHPDGTPILDPTPIAPPIGYVKVPSMIEIVRDMVRGERLKQEAEAAGMETFEESEDFDIPDDPVQLSSPYENDFDPPISEMKEAGRQSLEEKKRKASTAKPPAAAADDGGDPPSDGPKTT